MYHNICTVGILFLSLFVQPDPVHLPVNSNPYEVAIINSTLYWTELKQTTITGSTVRLGAIYTMNGDDNINKLIENIEVSPHDLCSFYDNTQGSIIASKLHASH